MSKRKHDPLNCLECAEGPEMALPTPVLIDPKDLCPLCGGRLGHGIFWTGMTCLVCRAPAESEFTLSLTRFQNQGIVRASEAASWEIERLARRKAQHGDIGYLEVNISARDYNMDARTFYELVEIRATMIEEARGFGRRRPVGDHQVI